MEITVIGFWGGYPAKNEASSGYFNLEYGDYRVLLDCGSGVLSELQNDMHPEELDAVVLSIITRSCGGCRGTSSMAPFN